MVQPTNEPRPQSELPFDVGQAIKLARTELNWSQGTLARKCNWSTSKVSRIETGVRDVSIRELRELARALQVPPQRFRLPIPLVPQQRSRQDSSSPRAPLKPAQLPLVPHGFVGRQPQLTALQRWYDDTTVRDAEAGVRIVVVSGTAGVGKTTLARRWAQRVAVDFPDGVLHINLRGFDPSALSIDPSEVLAHFLQSLGATGATYPANVEGREALYRSHVANSRLLIFLDNAADADQVLPLLPASPFSLVVITSRNNLSDLVARDGAYRLRLDPMPLDEARELLARRVGADRVSGETAAANQLIEACARLPLTIATAGARAGLGTQFSLRALTDELLRSHSRLDAFGSYGGDQSVRAVLACSYEPLPEPAQDFFRLLAVHPGPDFTIEAAASIANVARDTARALLVQLTNNNLLQEPSILRYSFHDLFHALAREIGQSSEDPDSYRSATRRMLDHYLRSAHSAASILHYPASRESVEPAQLEVVPETFHDTEDAFRWFEGEHAVLMALLRMLEAQPIGSYGWKIAWHLDPYLDLAGFHFELEAAWRSALRAAERQGDEQAQAICHRRLGHALTSLGHTDEGLGHLSRSMGMYESLGDLNGQALSSISKGATYDRIGDLDNALECARHAAALAHEDGDVRLVAKARNAEAWTLARLGDLQQARNVSAEALALIRKTSDQYATAATLDTAAYISRLEADRTEAIRKYDEAITICRSIGALQQEAKSSEQLALTYRDFGDMYSAEVSANRALEIYQSLECNSTTKIDRVLRLLTQLGSE